ncbi:transcriptional regulator [Nocardioides immobilis]|uniref:Transcriptional regulator n=1 Tax=Nocardioides immobilis TaxID=2049295 RepID=A0A417Y136_9ACTN|nr:helix-turn-helix domain-containing protein [Nocardioides immobilis]RHW26306.1 transcriptional regulator [Nocardioides immobilis]
MAARARVNLFRSPWDLELVAQSLLGVCRFDDFQAELGISRQVLAERLKELTAEEIFVRQQYQSRPDRYEYRLTRKGRDLLPVVEEMTEWAQRWRGHTTGNIHPQEVR